MEHVSDFLHTSALDETTKGRAYERTLSLFRITYIVNPCWYNGILNQPDECYNISQTSHDISLTAIGTCRPEQGFSSRFNRKHGMHLVTFTLPLWKSGDEFPRILCDPLPPMILFYHVSLQPTSGNKKIEVTVGKGSQSLRGNWSPMKVVYGRYMDVWQPEISCEHSARARKCSTQKRRGSCKGNTKWNYK